MSNQKCVPKFRKNRARAPNIHIVTKGAWGYSHTPIPKGERSNRVYSAALRVLTTHLRHPVLEKQQPLASATAAPGPSDLKPAYFAQLKNPHQ